MLRVAPSCSTRLPPFLPFSDLLPSRIPSLREMEAAFDVLKCLCPPTPSRLFSVLLGREVYRVSINARRDISRTVEDRG